MTWHPLCSATCELGESPFWHGQEQRLYWLDIPGKKILRSDLDGSDIQTWNMPSEPGCMAPAASGGLVIATRHGILRARTWGGDLVRIATLDDDPSHMRANDGKCDALGRFWVGTMDESKRVNTAALYCLDARGGQPIVPRRVLPAGAATTANGLGFSPNERTLYWADTGSHAVQAWDFDASTGTVSAQREFAHFAPKPAGWKFDAPNASTHYGGRPDGAAVDAQGNYYVAMYEGGRICKFASDGALLAQIPVPALCPTMPCFGGPDLKTLFVTTGRHGRSEAELAAYPLSGVVFSKRMEVPGLAVDAFVDS